MAQELFLGHYCIWTIMHKHMLIDMKNLLYRALFVGYYNPKFRESGHDYMAIVLRLLSSYVGRFKPELTHIFWDAPRVDVWRRNIVPHYKGHRSALYKNLSIDVGREINRLITISCDLFKHFGIRQYYKDGMEADDLVYAFCLAYKHDKLLIVTTDNDFKQIIFNCKHVDLHSPSSKSEKELVEIPSLDPAMVKSFIGDKSDNLKGYYKVGPKKAVLLVRDVAARIDFFKSPKAVVKNLDGIIHVGEKRFIENMSVIDMAMCPSLLDNIIYVTNKSVKPVHYSYKNIQEIVIKHKLRGLMADLSRYTSNFNKSGEI